MAGFLDRAAAVPTLAPMGVFVSANWLEAYGPQQEDLVSR